MSPSERIVCPISNSHLIILPAREFIPTLFKLQNKGTNFKNDNLFFISFSFILLTISRNSFPLRANNEHASILFTDAVLFLLSIKASSPKVSLG